MKKIAIVVALAGLAMGGVALADQAQVSRILAQPALWGTDARVSRVIVLMALMPPPAAGHQQYRNQITQ